MIIEAEYQYLNKINELGKNYNDKFDKLYNISSYIKNDNYKVLLFIENNLIKGFIICENLIDSIDIELIFVDIKFRKQGIGKKLVDKLLEYNKTINLEVNSNNIPAYNLYRKCGFIEIGTRKKYYHDGDCIMMRKDIL